MREEQESKNMSFSRAVSFITENVRIGTFDGSFLELSLSRSRQAKTARSSASLLGAYVNLERDARKKRAQNIDIQQPESNVINSMIKDHQGIENTRSVFNEIDFLRT